ncbi:cache domain-containing protein [Marinobacterium jannaschii]|uniref:cache domain-containing protein n=1 Tax=Marinobacterium jannaschii TaxID=64970 RepID=UPI000A06B082|nr:cache domain-containing protein [Marinobacterium jannaschii]
MLKSKLVRRLFLVILLTVVALFTAIYFYSVPFIKQTVFEIERNASRIALNNVFELANKIYFGLEGYRLQALDSHKKRLEAVVSLAEAYVNEAQQQVARGEISLEEAQRQVFEGLRNFTYGNNDYVWVASHDAFFLSHPDDRFHRTDASAVRTETGSFLIPAIVSQVVESGDGFFQYKWNRLDASDEVDKISYVRNYPQWNMVIGSGLYLDDIEAEVQQRKRAAVDELREALSAIKIAKTGYMFIFDGDGNMLIHPNPNIDQTNASELLEPVTRKPILAELAKAADTGKELYYQWDKPSDPGHYVHEKLSLVRYLKGFDWYIGSSVYVAELQIDSEVLTERILTIASVALLTLVVLSIIFVHWVARPIQRLAGTAVRVRAGDLSAKTGIVRDDELGLLASSFDTMVDRLRDNIHSLDTTVQARTYELQATNSQLREAVGSLQEAQSELALVEERQRMVLDALPAQIGYVDASLHYLFANRGYAEMFGMTKEEVVGKRIEEVLGQTMVDDMQDHIHRVLSGEEVSFDYRLQRDGRELITRRILIPHRNPDGRINGLLSLALDITAEKEAERRLTEAQRMNAVGELAGGLAHDFNNLLSIILGNLLAAQERYPEIADLMRYLEPAVRASRRGADITSRLLAFSRRQPLMPSAVRLESLLQDTLTLLEGSLPSHIHVSCEGDMNGCILYIDESQLENALVNLALNARDAMPQGGDLRFRVRRRDICIPEQYDELVVPGDYVEICVQDSGTGFDQDALALAYEPFFSTKTNGAGSGLGLSMVYGFVKQSQGYISIASEPGLGSVISLLLPISEAEAEIETAEQEGLGDYASDYSGQLMLLVEDDDDVRAVVRDQLRKLGFGVIEAVDADEAAELIESLDGLSGMLSDVVMPGKFSGFDLARMLYRKAPSSRILLMSGYAYDRETPDQHGISFTMLRKPFEPAALLKALRRASQQAGEASITVPGDQAEGVKDEE